jgi:hypothetical protein
MTDRELLELAAKAAGVPLDLMIRPDGLPLGCSERGLAISVEPGWWNPLKDDGDAFRLAVKLRFCVSVEPGYIEVVPENLVGTGTEEVGDDPCAAARRAIVLTAAAIESAA